MLTQFKGETSVGLEPILDLYRAGSQIAGDNRRGTIGNAESLPAEVDCQRAEGDLVFNMILNGLGVEVIFPLGEEGICLKFLKTAANVVSAG